MKVFLINPPDEDGKRFIREGRCTQEGGTWGTLWPPVSLATIGAVLEREGHAIRITDFAARGSDWSDLEPFIKEFSPDAVILSTGTPSIDNDLRLCSYIKENIADVRTIVFGTHVTALDEGCMEKYPGVDFVVRNEPEITVRELVAALANNGNLKDLNGITFRDSKGTIISNPRRPFLDDLDSLPFPAWHLVDTDLYRLPLKGNRYLIVSPSRGCPHRCTFCTCQTYYGKKLRKRSVENVLAEIELDIKKFNITDFFFWAETFVIDKEYVRNLCKGMLDRRLKISWTANARVDTVDGSLLQLMADSGCWMLSYGIESGDQSILDNSMKGTKVEQAGYAVSLAKDAGIKTAGHFMLGLPGETEDSIKKTIDFATTLDLDFAQFYSAVPFPGSQLYTDALAKGWLKSDRFEDYRQDRAVMALPSMPPERINYYRRVAFKRFYLAPGNLLGALKLIRLKGARRIIAPLFNFRSWAFKTKRKDT